jgi:Gpi18-like mannosyltransferase
LNRLLAWIIVAALVIRVAVIGSTGFYPDQQAFEQWALTLATHGPLAIYAPEMQPRVDYPPGYLYVLWGAGLAHLATGGGELGFRVAIKAIPILADLVLIVLVYRICRRIASERAALWVTGAIAILPPLWIDSAVYGQSDSVPIVFALASVMAILEGNAGVGLPFLAASLLIKPQALMIAPSIAVVFSRIRQRWLQLALGSVGGLVLAYVAALPFTVARSPFGVYAFLLSLYLYGAGKAPNATDGAFNLYAIITPFFTSDMRQIGPITYHTLGVILVVSFVLAGAVLLFWSLRDVTTERRLHTRFFGNANLSLLALFLFATRMHERYLLPALVFGAPLALDDVPSAIAMLWLAFTFSVNCTFIMVGFYGGNHHPITVKLAQAASIGNIVAFAVLWQRQWRRLFPAKGTN